MKCKKLKNGYIIRIDRGELIIGSLKKFCKKNKVSLGSFSGLGAVGVAELAHYIVENRRYTTKKFKEPLEIVNMSGNVALMKGEPYVHCHATLSNQKMQAFAGHLVEAKVAATCEIFLLTFSGKIDRKHDEKTGLNLLEL